MPCMFAKGLNRIPVGEQKPLRLTHLGWQTGPLGVGDAKIHSGYIIFRAIRSAFGSAWMTFPKYPTRFESGGFQKSIDVEINSACS